MNSGAPPPTSPFLNISNRFSTPLHDTLLAIQRRLGFAQARAGALDQADDQREAASDARVAGARHWGRALMRSVATLSTASIRASYRSREAQGSAGPAATEADAAVYDGEARESGP